MTIFAARCLAIAIVCHAAIAMSQSTGRPNILVILADDQGWGDLSMHGNPNVSTPNIDRLAASGVTLQNFYVCPVCAPTRAEFLTGRYHPRGGVRGVSRGRERMSGDEVTLAELLREDGYATAAYGKWHNGTQWPSHPNAQGFDDFYGFCSGHWGNYFSPMLEHNGRIIHGNGYLPDDLTDHAIEFIAADSSKPFFVYLPLNTPHSPMQVPDRWFTPKRSLEPVPDPAAENARDERIDMTRAALAMVENIDWNVGRLLTALQDNHQLDNTIIVYFSDNGPNSARFNGGMRGRKGSVHEGGVRSPCIVQHTGTIPAGVDCHSVAGAIDLMPTLLHMADVDPPADRVIDGINLADELIDQSNQIDPSRTLVTHWNNKLSVRSGRYRYHENGRLYDIGNDRGEHHDVAAANLEVVRRLSNVLAEYRQQVRPASRDKDTRPFVVNYPGCSSTQLPARDCHTRGNARHSNRHRNCTYIENWTSTTDSLTWPVEVAQPGPQRAILYYCAKRQNLGSVIELSCGEASLTRTIDQPNPSEISGRQRDRVPRIEGYVKDFQPLDMGIIDLPSGVADLTLRATKVVGEEVAEVRLLMLLPPE